MRFRSQLSPLSVHHVSQVGSADSSAIFSPVIGGLSKDDLCKWENVEFFHCRVVYGSGVKSGKKFRVKPFDTPGRTNWSALLGIGGAAVVSATLWVGIALTFGLIGR